MRDLGVPGIDGADWAETELIGDEGLGLDSLERLGALGALAETFGVEADTFAEQPPRVVGDWIDWIVRATARSDGRVTVHTSGSTGVARACSHAIADLMDEARFFAEQLPDRQRVVALVPAHHLYGIIWTALLPQVLGVPVVTRTIGASLDLAAGDLVVAVPEQWRAIERLTRLFPAGVMGVSSAGPLDDGVAAALLGKGLTRLIDIYGSSETGAIGLRDLPDTAYDLLPRWRLLADGTGDWRLVDAAGIAVDLPDHVECLGERRLRPTGRRDGAVQVAGHNVWPARVACVLSTVEGVAEAAVRLHVSGRLKAFVVPQAGEDVETLAKRLDQVIAGLLTEPERPKMFRFGVRLPRNAMGKLEDWA